MNIQEFEKQTYTFNNKNVHISLTGHRPNKLAGYDLRKPFYYQLHKKLLHIVKKIVQDNPDKIIWLHSGMALGADTVWGFVAKTAKKEYPNQIKFYAEIPVLSQSNIWKQQVDKDRWQELYHLADDKNIYGEKYTPQVMQLRNIGMINHADLVIAIFDGSKGGTENAVTYAKKENKDLLIIRPDEI